MTLRKTVAASLIVLVTLQACNKKEVVKNEATPSDSMLKKDSIVVSPMAHIMDSVTTSGQTFS
ncbi:MAG: hypothetical protein H7195_08520, partial [Chryseobacterium sp.]|nr:hypothetical protein [Chryseobacterium sp.]